MSGYRTIVCDPPWTMPSGGRRSGGNPANSESMRFAKHTAPPSDLPYQKMTISEIAALPVDDLADASAHLYVWTTNAFLESTYSIVRNWGFRPSQMLVWAKTPRGLGMGGAFTNTTEFILFAWRGSCAPLQRSDSSWWQWKRGAHSAKPESFLDLVEHVSPAPRLEMFARRNRLGWDTWGNEALNHVELGASGVTA